MCMWAGCPPSRTYLTLTTSLSHYLTILLSNYLTKVGWLLLSLTDPMGPPGPVLEAVLSAGGEVSGQ